MYKGETDFDVIIVGGGLAGLISGILLSNNHLKICLIEKKKYPFHRVCGEYISNEVIPFLEKHDLFPTELGPSDIKRFQLTSTNGLSMQMPLDLGAFGISRFKFDEFLLTKAISSGVTVKQGNPVTDFKYRDDHFLVNTNQEKGLTSRLLISAHGKRSTIDKHLDRDFISKKSPYIGVKYHISLDFPPDLIALHNFKNGYCGISKVEGNTYNLCYLSHRSNLKKHNGDIKAMEEQVLWRNPYLKDIYRNANFLFDKPEVINEISFDAKPIIEDHALMVGDSAGMITPLCGNGMAMAIHGAKMVSETIIENWNDGDFDRLKIEQEYASRWSRHFRNRIRVGREIQKLFGSTVLSNFSVLLAKIIKPLSRGLMSLTHGEPFS